MAVLEVLVMEPRQLAAELAAADAAAAAAEPASAVAGSPAPVAFVGHQLSEVEVRPNLLCECCRGNHLFAWLDPPQQVAKTCFVQVLDPVC